MKRAKNSKAPIKYSILAYIHFNEGKTSKQIAKALHLKQTTVRSYLNKLMHEAEIDSNVRFWQKKKGKRIEARYHIEMEWNGQPSIINGLFMTQKGYQEFRKSKTWINEIQPLINSGSVKLF